MTATCERRPPGRAFALLVVGVALVLTASSPSARTQLSARQLDLPPPGQDVRQTLALGESHDWRADLTTAEYLDIRIEGIATGDIEEWPAITVTAPDGSLAYESRDPSLVPGLDMPARVVVSFVAETSGRYTVRVAARGSAIRYRLRVDARRFSIDSDRQRLAAHRIWRDAMQVFQQRTPEALRAAIEKYEQAQGLLAGIGDDEGEALTLGTIAKASYNLSDVPRGKAATTRALELWRRLGREQEEGVALSDLGLLAYVAHDHAAARSYYTQALAKHRVSGDRESEARTLTRVGWVQYAAAELQQVLQTNDEAMALYRAVGDSVGESIAYNDTGRAYLDLGEVAQALVAFDRALALRPADRFAGGAANILNRIGTVYLNVAEWQRALDALQQARTLAKKGHDDRAEISSTVNLGSAYVMIGDTREASRYLEPVLPLARSIDFRSAEAYALMWLGVGAAFDGEPAKSRDYLQKALAILAGMKDVRGQTVVLRQLGAVQMDLGSPQEALASVNRSIELAPNVSGFIYSGALTLADVYAALGDAQKARAQYEAALERFREVRARKLEMLALTRYGRFQAAQGQYAEARDLLEKALAINESLRGLIVDPDLRMSYSSTSIGPYALYTDVLMELDRRSPGGGFAATAFHASERARARGLLEMLGASGVDIHQGVDLALVERERALRWNLNSKAALQTSLLAGRRDDRRLTAVEQEIADLSRSWRETTTQIRQQSPVYASLTEPEPLTVRDVGALLDADTVLLEYAQGEAQTWLYAVTPTSFESFALPKRQAIEDAARDVHGLLRARQPIRGESAADREARIARADAQLAERSRALSDLVLGPIGDKLATEWRGRRLAIVTAGALEYVPFAALPVPGQSPRQRRTPLVAAHEIVTLPSASSLALLRQGGRRAAPSKLIAVFADPVFAADDPRVGRAAREERPSADGTRSTQTRALEPFVGDDTRGSLARLPFSRAEALAVASQVPRNALLQATDFDATLALATDARLNDYRIIHFATHGLINTRRPELSGLALSLVDREGRSRDGFLRLNTIYNMHLSADLVVLSACESALGKEVAGEGLVGLTRGFMYAGARRVIASLWQVSDVATAELMKKFYAGMLQQHLPAAAALRRAQLDMASDPRWASPYFWAGFVLQGDWQP